MTQEDQPPPTPGISLEEAEHLRSTIDDLETEVNEVKAQLAAKLDVEKRLSEN